MKIDLLCNDGSPLGVTPPLIYGRGVGGAELAMMSLMESLAARGHECRVFNNPAPAGVYDRVEYLPLAAFSEMEPRDAIIVFRSPNARITRRHGSARIVWWSCDQYTIGDFSAMHNVADGVVVISPYHRQYHISTYGMKAEKLHVIDLGVRLRDYDAPTARVPRRAIFCSVPDRGLNELRTIWRMVRDAVTDATLVITSDYRLWGLPDPRNAPHRLHWAGEPGVNFVGAVPRMELARYQQEAEVLIYPCTYEELFCISVAECEVAGAVPITSALGALPTTNEFGDVLRGEPTTKDFQRAMALKVIDMLTERRGALESQRVKMMNAARRRFDWAAIAEQWEIVLGGTQS